ncbi:60S ribosomal protein L10a [Spraguea lophii 42_110]|uniref:60S ribosomal protein L10a n=1 Tax=Spraguea lophii (strain 42_110) TaxID=1358809 RepID=S7W9N5_SPRLO|nr:60S ribosomal protein L10a [Spraguea lophii 42_110]
MNFYSREKIVPILSKMVEEAKKKSETIEVQMSLKGYDFKKDVRFDSNVVLPHQIKRYENITVIGDSNLKPIAEEAKVPFVLFSDIEGNSKERQKIKKKLAMKSDSYISTAGFNKYFEMKYFNKKRKPVLLLKNIAEFNNFYDEVKRTVKFKLRKTGDISFTIGHLEMEQEEVYQNLVVGLNHLNSILKKGLKSLGTVFIKSTQGKPTRIL